VSGAAIGVDVGATLAKIAVRGLSEGLSEGPGEEPGEALDLELLPAADLDAIVERVEQIGEASIGLTGCGATDLAARLASGSRRIDEFEAWGTGAGVLLGRQDAVSAEPFLLVSVGTGTSVLRVEGESVERVGGTALGGGSLLGLGAMLTGCSSHSELCTLARSGKRAGVDLLISDIYHSGEIALPDSVTAASFGALARRIAEGEENLVSPPEDLAAAVTGLVGENVGLICCNLAALHDTRRIVFGGATLQDNPSLVAVLSGLTTLSGFEAVVLENGAWVGAVGALSRATDA
jgi:type II pantothenate kinase